MNLVMQHLGLKLYKVYINFDLDLFYDKVKFLRVTKMCIYLRPKVTLHFSVPNMSTLIPSLSKLNIAMSFQLSS